MPNGMVSNPKTAAFYYKNSRFRVKTTAYPLASPVISCPFQKDLVTIPALKEANSQQSIKRKNTSFVDAHPHDHLCHIKSIISRILYPNNPVSLRCSHADQTGRNRHILKRRLLASCLLHLKLRNFGS